MRTVPEWFFKQSAVIPFRIRNGKFEVLLITSRKGKKWIIPKGVIEPDLSPGESAKKEALEEAGVEGILSEKPLGKYRYNKWSGTCKVKVYSLQVNKIHKNWLEKSYRKREWVSQKEAAERLSEKKLKKMILGLKLDAIPKKIEAPESVEYQRENLLVSCDPTRLNFDVIHGFLSNSYWSPGIPVDVVKRAAANSLCFGMYEDGKQIGYARVITDFTAFAYLADVFVLATHQGRGLGKWLMECIMAHPQLQSIRRWMLATRDAHNLYQQYGFSSINEPKILMEKLSPGKYVAADHQPPKPPEKE